MDWVVGVVVLLSGSLLRVACGCNTHLIVRVLLFLPLQKPDVFQSEMMLAQLRYAGLLEVCRIRQIGYPVRKSFDDFLFRYRCLALTAAQSHVTLLRALEDKGIAKKNQWQIGHTKVRRALMVEGAVLLFLLLVV